jgi:hypothetical protein
MNGWAILKDSCRSIRRRFIPKLILLAFTDGTASAGGHPEVR